jgi:hypothetical protein
MRTSDLRYYSSDKFYIVILERGGLLEGFNYAGFHKQLTSAKGVTSWWHYMDTTYILRVTSDVDAASITDFIRSIAPKKKFFVCALNLSDRNGWLPHEAWDWIKKQLPTQLP